MAATLVTDIKIRDTDNYENIFSGSPKMLIYLSENVYYKLILQMGHLSVVIPPDIVDSISEGSSAQEGGSIRLACSATGVPPPTVLWRRENNKPIVYRHEGGRERKGKNKKGKIPPVCCTVWHKCFSRWTRFVNINLISAPSISYCYFAQFCRWIQLSISVYCNTCAAITENGKQNVPHVILVGYSFIVTKWARE